MLTQAVGRGKQFADRIDFGERQIRKQARFDVAERAVACNFPGHGLTPLTPSGGLGARTRAATRSRQLRSAKGTAIGCGEEPVLESR